MRHGEGAPVVRFAARTLGLEPGIPPDEVRAALLQRLRDEDYVLDPVSHEAVLVCSGRPESLAPRLAEAAARAEFEAFTAAYFDLPVGERRDRWVALATACVPYEPLSERLRLLEHGLDIDRQAILPASPLVDRLIAHALELYLLRPAPRAARRRELVASLQYDPAIGKRVVRRARRTLRKTCPAVAKLVPEFLNDLDGRKTLRPKRRPSRDPFSMIRNLISKAAARWPTLFVLLMLPVLLIFLGMFFGLIIVMITTLLGR